MLAPLLTAPVPLPDRRGDPGPVARRDGGDHRPPGRGRRRRRWPRPSRSCAHAEGQGAQRERAAHAASGGDPGRWVSAGWRRRRRRVGAGSSSEALAVLAGELESGVGGDQVHGCAPRGGRRRERLHTTNVRTIVDSSRPRSVRCCGDRHARPTAPPAGPVLDASVLVSGRSDGAAGGHRRTLRRDVTRLRDLGYPIESTTGRHGGYALGAGGRLPPLLLDDDEAVAVTLGLQQLSGTADPSLAEAAIAALAKVVQVMPSALRERVETLGAVTVRLGRAAAGRRRLDRRRDPDGAGPGRPARRSVALRLPHGRRPDEPTPRRAPSARLAAQPLVPRRLRPRPRRLADVPRRPRRAARAPPASRAPTRRHPTRRRSSPRAWPCGSTTSRPASASPCHPTSWPTRSRRRWPSSNPTARRHHHDGADGRRARLHRHATWPACRSPSRCSIP